MFAAFSRLIRTPGPADGTPAGGADATPSPLPELPAETSVAHDDRAEDDALREALIDSRQRYKDIVEASGDFAWETDAGGCFTFVSSGERLGYGPDDLAGRPAARFLAEPGIASRETPFHARDAVRDVDVWLRTAEGRQVCFLTAALPVHSADGEWRGARGVCRDVTEERRRDAEFAGLRRREALMARIVQQASNRVDPDDMLRVAIAESRNAFAADYGDIRIAAGPGSYLPRVIDGVDGFAPPVLATVFGRMAESATMVTAADSDRCYLCAPALFRGEAKAVVLLARDLSAGIWSDEERSLAQEVSLYVAILLEQIELRDRLAAMARTDELTGLLNRRAFMAELEDRIARLGESGSVGSLFYVDLDNFKSVNDEHGHGRGDEALCALAGLLVTRTRAGDLVARLGGDEFAMWLERTDEETAAQRANALLDAASGLRVFSGSPEQPLGISIGVAVYRPGSGESVCDLTGRADAAMYDIKRGTKGGFVLAPDAAPRPEGDGKKATAAGDARGLA